MERTRFPTRWSIRTHFILLVAVILLPLAGVGVYSVVLDARQSARQAEETALTLAHVTAATVHQVLDDAVTMLEGLALRPEIRELDAPACDDLLGNLREFFPQYTNLFLVDENAGLVCSGLPPAPDAPELSPDTEWFQRVMQAGEVAVGKAHLGLLSNRWNSVVGYPVTDETGAILGAVAVALDLVRFQDLIADPSLPPGTVITIDDLEGMVVARSSDSESWIGRTLPTSGISPEVLEGPGGITVAEGAEGVVRVWGFTAVPRSGWRVWAGIPTGAIYGPVLAAARYRLLLGGLIFLAAVILAVILYRRLARSLVTLVEESQEAALGGNGSLSLQGPREVQEVAAQFNRTLEARTRAEAAHRQSLERYRSIMENAVFGIGLITERGQFLEVNPALEEMLGYESAKALKEISFSRIHAGGEGHDEVMTALMLEGRVEGMEVAWERRDGSLRTVRLSGTRIRRQGGQMAFEVIAEDVTEQKALEERMRQSQKMEALGRLAGGVAHDFNNLLTVVTGNAHLLLSELLDGDPRREEVEEILEAAEHGASLTGQLLALSRRQVLQPVVLDLNRVVEGMHGLLNRLMENGTVLLAELDPELWPVRADPGQVEQIILNLVLNARDALTGEGRPVEILTRNVVIRPGDEEAPPELPPGPYVSLTVRDEGMGIPYGIQHRVFEPFFTTKPEGKGTGLGLATVYGIATQSGGHVRLRSAPGKGSEFTVFLPMAESAAGILEASPEAVNPSGS